MNTFSLYRWVSLFLLFLLFHTNASAQILGSPPEGEGRVWNIRFIVDPGLSTWRARYRDVYQGERYDSETDSWSWTEWDSTDNRILDFYKAGNVRLGVMVNLYDRLYVGVNYCFYLVQGFRRQPGGGQGNFSYVYWPFISLSGSVNYDYILPLPFTDRLSLQPTLSFGTYQSERSFEGIGQELAFEGRLGLAYRFRAAGESQVRIWANYQHLTYQASEPSLVYPERRRVIESEWDLFTVGLGMVWHLKIQEDRDANPSGELRRKTRKAEKLRKKQERLQRKLDKAQNP